MGEGKLVVIVSTRSEFWNVVVAPGLYIDFDLVLEAFDLHNLAFKSGILLHVEAVDPIQLSKNGYFKVVNVVLHLLLQTVYRLSHFLLLSLEVFLVIAQIALFMP